MREFTFDREPIKFKIKSIEGSRIEITSISEIGNIVFTIFGKSPVVEDIKTKYDLDITHMKFLALVDEKDYRIAAMDSYMNNDEKADVLIDCLHVHAEPDATDEEKQAAARILTSTVNGFYNAYVREQEQEELRRKGGDRDRSDYRSRSDSRDDYRADYSAASAEVGGEDSEPVEPEEPIVAPRKQRVPRPAPKKKSMKQKPVRVRKNKPKFSE